MSSLAVDLRPATVALICVAATVVFFLAGCSSGDSNAVPKPETVYAAVASGRVDVEGGLLDIHAPRDGTIASVPAQAGTTVQRGEILATLDDTAAILFTREVAAELEQARAQQRILSGQLASARQRADRLAAAARAGAGEIQAADDAQSAATRLVAEIQAAKAAIDTARAKLALAEHEVARDAVRAPLQAHVVRINVQPGSIVSPQSPPLLQLLPLTAHIVRADLSEVYIDAVHAGMSATVAAEGDTSGHWRARVLRVSPVVGVTPLDDDPQRRGITRTAECVLQLEPEASLRVGQRVLVRFDAAAAAAKD